MKMKPAVTRGRAKKEKERESETHLRPNVVLHRSSSVVVVVSTARKTNFVPMNEEDSPKRNEKEKERERERERDKRVRTTHA